ncbi:hypothetical protein CJF32_00003652 [Rutstroemia sp. NJR-2017a WRK4]|nr:hypothetical protein CJF32_00003652 [Rutstroemia sp. NJR-2017a WRK4]
MPGDNKGYGSSPSSGGGSGSGGSNVAQYRGSSRYGSSSGSDDASARTGFSNFSQNPRLPQPGQVAPNSYPSQTPQSALAYRARQGVPQNPILYGDFQGRASTSTYPTNPDLFKEHRDDYRTAVATGVPAGSPMAQLGGNYKTADDTAVADKEACNKYRKDNAASDKEAKADRKRNAKDPTIPRAYKGTPAGNKEFHQEAMRLLIIAIRSANLAANLRKQMAHTYPATEKDKRAADGHRTRAEQWVKSAANMTSSYRDHQNALSELIQGETAAAAAQAAKEAREAAGDQESSDNEPQQRRPKTTKQSNREGKRRERSREGREGSSRKSGR